jgi:hypothetical protein
MYLTYSHETTEMCSCECGGLLVHLFCICGVIDLDLLKVCKFPLVPHIPPNILTLSHLKKLFLSKWWSECVVVHLAVAYGLILYL